MHFLEVFLKGRFDILLRILMAIGGNIHSIL